MDGPPRLSPHAQEKKRSAPSSGRGVVHNEIAIYGSRANPNVSNEVIPLISSGQLSVKDLITHVFPLVEFERALDTFGTRREGAIKVIVEPNGSEEGSRGH